MRAREKILVVSLIVTVLLGTVVTLESAERGVNLPRPESLVVDNLAMDVSDSLTIIINRMRGVLDASSLWYGGISLLALMMVGLALRFGRDAELRSLRSKINALEERLSEAVSHKKHAERSLQTERNKKEDLAREKDSAIQEVEETFKRLHRLTTDLREKQETLKARDGELRTLRSQVGNLKAQLEDVTTENERTEKRLREAVSKRPEPVPDNQASNELEPNVDGPVQRLKTQLIESQEMLKLRDAELDTLRSQADALTGQLAAISTAKERAESLRQRDLDRNSDLIREKELSVQKLEKDFSQRVHDLEKQLQEKQNLIDSRDVELENARAETNDLSHQLAEASAAKGKAESALQEALTIQARISERLTTAREQAESLLQEEIKQSNRSLQEKESALRELELSLSDQLRALESRLSEKQEELKNRDDEIQTLRAELSSLSDRLGETAFARERAEKFLQAELRKNQELVLEKQSAIQEIEANFGIRLRALEEDLDEKQQLLSGRDEQLEALRSELNAAMDRLAGTVSAKEQAESLLQEELSKLAEEKNAVSRELDVGLKTIQSLKTGLQTIQSLENDLNGKVKLLESRDRELETLRLEATGLKAQIDELESDNRHAEKLLEQERWKAQELETNGLTVRELEHELTARLHTVENELYESQKLLTERSRELTKLTSEMNAFTTQIAETTGVREALEIQLENERKKNNRLAEETDSTIRALEESLSGTINALAIQVNEKDALLERRQRELEVLRSELTALNEQVVACQSAREQAEHLLQEELRRDKLIVPLNDTVFTHQEDNLSATIETLESQLSEKQEALRKRDSQIESLVSELREKKILLAREEIADLQSIRRRNTWKRRLAKLGIPTKQD